MGEDIVIQAEGLGKKYAIGHVVEREPYVALRDVLVRGAHNLWRKAADVARGWAIVIGDSVEGFWALTDVSFEVKRGCSILLDDLDCRVDPLTGLWGNLDLEEPALRSESIQATYHFCSHCVGGSFAKRQPGFGSA
jgi:hypothetical protein